ncbi:nucleotidyltransferase [Sulfitobacter sp. R18_1]|uniref:nucleotidyltransferase domain-containing protein n=1 Tax=Sulfitobacter sp. R18_1 TaxID=2821104 RepID=UPI001ADB22BB|nr:nucleotidyltransferase [Sulfitobacter sp. R18_1]MBO9429593.1 nucleotidyltransferase [Sulfitobacter sp. R18_1]
MAITENQLDTWSHVGSQQQSAATYQAIRSVLEHRDAPYAGRDFEIFLQGSYGNDTNVRGSESDVDVVICLTDVFNSDISGLDPADKQAYEANRSPASYGFSEFKAEVLAWLGANFGSGVTPGRKAIAVPGEGNRRDADVLACIEHHRYTSYRTPLNNRYHVGVNFFSSDGDRIVNFPKQHKKNCTSKHQATNGRFKSNVRVLKNLRNAMVNDGYLKKGIAPSYFLEGMLWNVPNQNFVAGYQQSFENYICWLERCNVSDLSCANDLHWLIRENSNICWSLQGFQTFLTAARQYWNSSGR